MSLLEDRLTRIIELRQQGGDEISIAQQMNLTPLLIQQYESTVKQAVERVFSGGYGDKVRLARRIGISPLVLELCLQCYFPQTAEKIPERVEPEAAIAQVEESGNQIIAVAAVVREPAEGEAIAEAADPEQEPPLKTASNDNIVMLITRLRQQGINTSSIAEQLHLPLRTVGRLEKQMSDLVRLINASTQEEAEELESLRRQLRISPFVVEWYLQQYRPEAPTKLYQSRRIARGTSLAQEKSWSERSTGQYERYQEKNRERLEKIRLLAEEGKSLAEIRKEVGWSELTVRRKIIGAGLYHPWKKKQVDPRQEQRELNQQRLQFCSFLLGPLSDRAAAREGWPVQKALEYERSRKLKNRRSIPLKSLICLFTNYEAASSRGERPSYQQLARRSGLHGYSSTTVTKILHSVNVEPLGRNVDDEKSQRQPLPTRKKVLSEEQQAKVKVRQEKLEQICRLAEEDWPYQKAQECDCSQKKSSPQPCSEHPPSRVQERIGQIRKLVEQGADSSPEIAKRLGLKPSTVYNYARQGDITLPDHRKNASRFAHYVAIREAQEQGITTVDEITTYLQLSRHTVENYLSDMESMHGMRLKRIENIVKMKSLMREGYTTVEEFAARLKIPPVRIRDYGLTIGYVFPRQKKVELKQLHAQILGAKKEGASILEIAQLVRLSPRRVRWYLERLGSGEAGEIKPLEDAGTSSQEREQSNLNNLLQQRKSREGFLSLLEVVVAKQTNNNRPLQKVVEYAQKRPKTSYSQSQLVNLFTRYYTALQENKKLYLEELSEGSIHPALVRRILTTVGLKPMRTFTRTKISSELKAKIRKASRVGLSAADISYFSGLPVGTVGIYRAKGSRGTPIIRFRDGLWLGAALTYRLCNQIYEAEDLGFNRRETAELYDTTKEVVAYAHKYKPKLKKVLIDILESFHPGERITKPYSVAKERKSFRG